MMQKLSFGRASVPSCMTSGLNSEAARDAADVAQLTRTPHKDPVDSPFGRRTFEPFIVCLK